MNMALERREVLEPQLRRVLGREGELGNRSKFQELDDLLRQNRGKTHVVLIQGSPDPDAISTALALKYLAARHEIETSLMTFASVSHHENRALIKRLGIQLERYEKGAPFGPCSLYSIVDSQRVHTPLEGRLEEMGAKFLAFIDHHREEAVQPPATFIDIREDASSTAAIVTEYLSELYPHGLESGDEEHVRLGTALMHGIRSDTARFLHANRMDFTAAAFLSAVVDTAALEIIERKILSPAVLGIFEKALVNRRALDNFIISDVGFVRSADRDGIPQAAELLLSRQGTDTALVFGVVDEQTIDGSLRTRSEMINPDEFLKGFLGASPESGRYYGGGNVRDRGAFQIPLGFLAMYESKEQVYMMAREVIERSFLAYIGKNGGGER